MAAPTAVASALCGSTHVSNNKRLVLIAALAALVSVGWTTEASAQRRRVPVRRIIVAPYVSPLWYYDPWFYDLQWGGVYGPYGGYYPHRYRFDPGSAVKLEVKPKQAEVFVDGYYAGVVDDFDGTFQSLRLPPGEHEIELYLDGYRTNRQKIYLQPDNTFKLKHEMERLGAGEQPEPRPQPTEPPPSAAAPGAPGQPGNAPPPYARRPPPPPRGQQDPRGARAPEASYGTLSVRVQPGPADIIVDGERWQGPEGQERIFIELPEGRHTIEIRRQGYRSYVTEVDVRRGETTPLNVSLRSQDDGS
jgi:hypothetical protein